MYPMYNKTEQERLDYETRLIQAAHKEGYEQGIRRGLADNSNNEKHYAIGYKDGRHNGFRAGFAAATGKSKEMEESHQQQKNGCGY